MKTSISKVVIHATAGEVWKALTIPELVKKWQYGTDLATDWSKGGPIAFRNEWNGDVFIQNGTVLQFDPTRTLSYSLFAPRPGMEDSPENRFVMTYQLVETNGITELTILQEDPREPASQESEEDKGENPVLRALKELVENG